MNCLWCHQHPTTGEDSNTCQVCLDAHMAKVMQGENVQGAWSRATRLDRETYAKEILQPYKPDGSVNESFKKAYGDKAYKKK